MTQIGGGGGSCYLRHCYAMHTEIEMCFTPKKTIPEEIQKYNKEKREGSKSEGILPVNTSPAKPKEKSKIQSSTD